MENIVVKISLELPENIQKRANLKALQQGFRTLEDATYFFIVSLAKGKLKFQLTESEDTDVGLLEEEILQEIDLDDELTKDSSD